MKFKFIFIILQILIAVKENFTLSDLKQDLLPYKVNMPQLFLRDETLKLESHVFRLFTYEELTMALYIRIFDAQYTNMRTFFLQTASIEINIPHRAIYGMNNIFTFVLKNNQVVNLPRNLPTLNSDLSYPSVLITYYPMDENQDLHPLNLTQYQNKIEQSNSNYWRSKDQLTIPYVPYINNCKESGEFIYLHEFIENPSLCELYAPEDTVPVKQSGFKQYPISDYCDKIVFQCLLDDAFNDNNNYPKLYQQKQLTELFYITKYSTKIDNFVNGSDIHNSLDLIPIIATNEVPSSYLPKTINLKINYFQVDQYEKKIITATMTFGRFFDITNYNESIPFKYNFTLTFHSMSHAELAIAFALDWPIYLLLSCIIGIFSICFTILYHIFFRLANIISRRQIIKEDLVFKFNLIYLKKKLSNVMYYVNLYTPIVAGICIGVIPSFILHSIASLSMLGGFWSVPLAGCAQVTTDEICENSILEVLVVDNYMKIKNGSTLSQNDRRGRLGITLIIIGFYGCIRMSSIFIPITNYDKVNNEIDSQIKQSTGSQQKILKTFNKLIVRDTIMVTECYDGNIWYEKIWKRGLYLHMALLIWIIMLVILNLSFSTYYGVNQWLFTFLLKFTQIVIEECLKIYIENELLLGSLSCVIAMTLSVSGLGALNFFEYLFTYFVSLGISTFEKTNQVLVVDFISDGIFDFVEGLKKWIIKQFEYENTEDDRQQQNHIANDNQTKEGTIQNDNDDDDSLISRDSENSGIILTEEFEQSMDTFEDENENVEIKPAQKMAILNRRTTRKQRSNAYSGQIKRTIVSLGQYKSKKQVDDSADSLAGGDDDEIWDEFEAKFKRYLDNKIIKQSGNIINESNKEKTKEEENQEHVSTIIKIYTDFCNSSFTLIQTVVQMWMFYDANQSFVKWGITKAGLIFYFLFNISNIPFQIVMDLLFLKTVEQLHQIHIKEYVQQVGQRFKNRKFDWKIDDEHDYLKDIDQDLQYIDHWCFSSQYFFCLSVFVGGSMAILQGSLIILANNYNFLKDEFFILIAIVWIFISVLVDMFCISVYNNISLWKIKDKPSSSNEDDYQDEIKTTEHQQLMATELYTKEFPKHTENVEDSKQPMNNIHLFSRESMFIKQGTDQDHFVKQSILHKQISFFNKNRELLDFDHKYSMNNNNFQEFSQQDIEKQQQLKKTLSNKSTQSFQEQLIDFENLKQLIQKNQHIRQFLEDAIEELQYGDLSVQNYLVHLFDKKEFNNIPLEDKYEEIVNKYRQRDPDPQRKQKKWLSFKENIKKAVKIKNKLMKLKEIMVKFENNEYKDEKFKQRFLQLNKKWFHKNAMILFQELMIGESQKDLIRPNILQGFQNIYGELENSGSISQINEINDDKNISVNWETRATRANFNNLITIVKYWQHRSKVQSLAEKCVAGYIMKGEQKNCFYCKSSWGITMQITNTNIEDLFLNFYKKECRRQRQFINVFAIVNGYTQQLSQKRKQSILSSQSRLVKKGENLFPFDQSLHDSINESYFEPSAYFVSRQQKFIEQWQEYFFQNAKFLHVCLICNNEAQTAFVELCAQRRRLSLKNYKEEYEYYFNNILTKQLKEDEKVDNLNSSQYINSPLIVGNANINNIRDLISKEDFSEQDEFNSPGLISEMIFTQSIFHTKKQTVIQPQNTIIKEENNEDQSQADKLSRLDGDEFFFSPQPRRKKSSMQSKSLKRSQSSIKPTVSSQRIQLPLRKNNGQGLRVEQTIDDLAKCLSQAKENNLETQQEGQENNLFLDTQGSRSERKDSEFNLNKSYKSAKSLSKTHPDLSQNNLEDLNSSRKSDLNKQIEDINKKLEESNNRSFRLIQSIRKVDEDDFGFDLKNTRSKLFNNSKSIQNFNDFTEEQNEIDDFKIPPPKQNLKQRKYLERIKQISRIKNNLKQNIEDEIEQAGKINNDSSSDQSSDDSKEEMYNKQSEQKNESLFFINTSQNKQQFITPIKVISDDRDMFTEDNRLNTQTDQVQSNTIFEESSIFNQQNLLQITDSKKE